MQCNDLPGFAEADYSLADWQSQRQRLGRALRAAPSGLGTGDQHAEHAPKANDNPAAAGAAAAMADHHMTVLPGWGTAPAAHRWLQMQEARHHLAGQNEGCQLGPNTLKSHHVTAV